MYQHSVAENEILEDEINEKAYTQAKQLLMFVCFFQAFYLENRSYFSSLFSHKNKPNIKKEGSVGGRVAIIMNICLHVCDFFFYAL